MSGASKGLSKGTQTYLSRSRPDYFLDLPQRQGWQGLILWEGGWARQRTLGLNSRGVAESPSWPETLPLLGCAGAAQQKRAQARISTNTDTDGDFTTMIRPPNQAQHLTAPTASRATQKHREHQEQAEQQQSTTSTATPPATTTTIAAAATAANETKKGTEKKYCAQCYGTRC